MKQSGKILFCIISFLLTIFAAFPVCAQEKYSNEPYYIQNYDIAINVLENNSLEVTEKIDAYFNNPRHGIYRYIPVKNTVYRTDGTSAAVIAKIKNVDVSERCEKYYDDNDNYVLQIGSSDETVKGNHSYTISYVYKMGKDIATDYDELYYNIIGNGWDTYIENVTFSINMPKEFDENLIGFSTGSYGIAGTDIVDYHIDGNTIYGTLSDSLKPNQALTMRAQLPEGYFKFNALAYYFKHILMISIPLIALIVVIVLWAKFGKDKKIIDVVEFYPPENMNSARCAFWYKGSVMPKDTIGLLIELANEGYLDIGENASKYVLITKVKPYDGNDSDKRIFFNGLFKKSDKVYSYELEEKFYVHIDKIVKSISAANNYAKVFKQRSLVMRTVGWIISIASAAISFFILQSSFSTFEEFVCFGIGVIIAFISFVFSFFIRQRTDKGHEIKQRINGFKIFLETAEKERLEALVNENPKYFYDILPYAYVLGVSDKWIKKFEGIAIEPPTWYIGGNYNTIMMYSFINNTLNTASRSMTSAPQGNSSFGGGYSGGGFSGGGGGFSGGGVGGGGGGSW